MRATWGKRILSFLLSGALVLQGCGVQPTQEAATSSSAAQDAATSQSMPVTIDEAAGFTGLNDPNLIQYVQDGVYATMENELGEDYRVESVQAVYVSKEYLEELQYNSQENIYFGYSLNDLEGHFQGTKYVFTVDDNGQTVAHAFNNSEDNTFSEVVTNVAIGGGVILVCVTVSLLTANSAPVVSMVFAASAKMATEFAVSGAVLGGAGAALVTGIQTGDPEEALKQAAITGSESFKWGAFTGAVAGGLEQAGTLYYANSNTSIPTPRESELRALTQYGGHEQVTYLAGEEVAYGTPGATRPDIVKVDPNGAVEAIEVKNYNLESKASLNELLRELRREVSDRITNLPAGSTQRVVLDTKGRRYPTGLTDGVVTWLQGGLQDVYPNIPIDIMK